MKPLLYALLVVSLAGCNEDNKNDRESNVAKSQFIYEIDTQTCAPVEHCSNIGRIDCDSETDGPLYYFDLQSEEVVSTCGGVCLAPTGDQVAVCETMCPPPAFNCVEP